MRVAVCDDEAEHNLLLCRLLDRYAFDRNTDLQVDSYTCAEELLKQPQYDLYLLDFIMPQMSGASLACALNDRFRETVSVCFLTSFEGAAVEVINRDIQAGGFLIKPVNEEKLFAMLDKLCLKSGMKRLVLKGYDGMITVYPKDIYFFEAANKTCLMVGKDGQTEIFCTITQLEEQLPAAVFIRVHRSFIVNLGQVSRYDAKSVWLKNGQSIPLRRDKEFLQAVRRYVLDS